MSLHCVTHSIPSSEVDSSCKVFYSPSPLVHYYYYYLIHSTVRCFFRRMSSASVLHRCCSVPTSLHVVLLQNHGYFVPPMSKQKNLWPTQFLLLCSETMKFAPFGHPSHSVLSRLQNCVKNSPLQTIPQVIANVVFLLAHPPPAPSPLPSFTPSYIPSVLPCVCVCACVRARARVRVCVRV